MRTLLFIVLGLSLITQSSHLWAMGRNAPIETVPHVDLNRYLGKWYEIERLPQYFEKGCVGVTANYALRAEGKIDVTNTCRKNFCLGSNTSAQGIARVVDTSSSAKLKVSFFWPFEGDYWIFELDPEYSYAVVGSPDRKSLWILSRSPTLPTPLLERIETHFKAMGFPVEKLEHTLPCD